MSLDQSTPDPIDIFISHSSKDAQKATLMAHFFLTSLAIGPERIRCTSAPGFQLNPGVSFSTQLKRDLQGCKCVIGLVTDKSLSSLFVLFELGAG